MTTFEAKVGAAIELVQEMCAHAQAPVVYSSFGKDSMVLLEVVKLAGRKLPVLFHREPFFPHKYAYANQVIAQEGYTVYDYPPEEMVMVQSPETGELEVGGLYRTGGKVTYLPTGITKPREGEAWLCGLGDLYQKPTCKSYDFPWDLCLIGHKSSDVDPILGAVPLYQKAIAYPDAPTYVFPLADFTDADVWDFHELYKIPPHYRRYQDRKELADKTHNPDYFAACTACVDRRQPGRVFCPRLGKDVENLSSQVTYWEPEDVRPQYLREGVRG